MNFIGNLIVLVGVVGVLVGLISIVFPLRFLHVYNRWMAIAVLVISCVMVNAGTQISPKLRAESAVREAQAAADRQRAEYERAHASRVAKESGSTSTSKPWLTTSGGCKTDVNGNMSCAHQSSADMGIFGKSTSTTTMKCGTHLVTGAYECKSESSSN